MVLSFWINTTSNDARVPMEPDARSVKIVDIVNKSLESDKPTEDLINHGS